MRAPRSTPAPAMRALVRRRPSCTVAIEVAGPSHRLARPKTRRFAFRLPSAGPTPGDKGVDCRKVLGLLRWRQHVHTYGLRIAWISTSLPMRLSRGLG
jgi:hypothetical protein